MKKVVITLIFAALCMMLSGGAAARDYKFTEASSLTLTGKLFPDTPNPYHRVDTLRFKGFTNGENLLVRQASGIACAFRTNSSSITVKTHYLFARFSQNGNGISQRGYDLYIRDNGKWYYAGSKANSDKKLEDNLIIVENLPSGKDYECLLYLPLYSELGSVQIGIEEDAYIEPLENPFRHRIAIFGSSYTHGSGVSRPGMTYHALFSRNTGIQMLNLGVSGRCLMQDYFCEVLCQAEDVDAFVFDAFSNPKAPMIKERLFGFIEKLQAAHPGKPLIFQKNIHRRERFFNMALKEQEAAKWAVTDSLMAIAVKKYNDVYYITPNATAQDFCTIVDGVHPGDYGHVLWEKSIEKPLLRILRKYGIK